MNDYIFIFLHMPTYFAISLIIEIFDCISENGSSNRPCASIMKPSTSDRGHMQYIYVFYSISMTVAKHTGRTVCDTIDPDAGFRQQIIDRINNSDHTRSLYLRKCKGRTSKIPAFRQHIIGRTVCKTIASDTGVGAANIDTRRAERVDRKGTDLYTIYLFYFISMTEAKHTGYIKNISDRRSLISTMLQHHYEEDGDDDDPIIHSICYCW
ncbi:hypothetical protein FF38_07510 [Lucilia cuprina]|uniref:Uncharacterized protein n=1 Tax=Lucilia cuprina TaxID=7375 RepID=A0A0L0CLV9_LUCCU|nr:hypothetical protein FF38_07510 [Lucilia cuprina]